MAADLSLHPGRYHVGMTASREDVQACQRLRHQCFFHAPGVDADRFDGDWQHMMVRDAAGTLVCTLRLRISAATDIASGYAAQVYDLARLAGNGGVLMELGRFCVAPDRWDPAILRTAWGALTRLVDAHDVTCVFGCTSFQGTDPAPYAAVFATLARDYLAPPEIAPDRKTNQPIILSEVTARRAPQAPMPQLLRSYLAMGGWVSNHAVVDQSLQTLHVLTGLRIADVPPARAKVLRALR